MTVAKLSKLIVAVRDKFLNSLDYSLGHPSEIAHGATAKDVVAEAIQQHIIQNGQMKIEGMIIGMPVASRGMKGLTSTDLVSLRKLLGELGKSVVGDLRAEIEARWKADKQRRGLVRKEGMTDAERFIGQGFQGFD